MAGVSASHLIIFIASLVVAAGVVGTLTTGVDRVSSAIDDRSLDVSQQVRMDMAFVSDSGADDYYESGANVSLYVRNTGSHGVPIDESAIDLVANAEFLSTGYTIDSVTGSDSTWRPGEVVRITIDSTHIDTGDNRILLIVNEDEETFEFRAS